MCPLQGQEGTRSLGMVLGCPGEFAVVFRMYSLRKQIVSESQWVDKETGGEGQVGPWAHRFCEFPSPDTVV